LAEGTTFHRRQVLRWGLSAAAMVASRPAMATTLMIGERRLSFHDTHTGESLTATYWADGVYVPEGLRAINHILRDFRTGDVALIDRKLLDLLHTLAGKLDTRAPYQVISGYRSPKTNALLASASGGVAKKSLHMQGMAIDIRLADTRLADLHQAAIDLRQGGVGFYPAADFIHVDVGRSRTW